MILGLKYALKKGFNRIHVQGDSKLVCMQVILFCLHLLLFFFSYALEVLISWLLLLSIWLQFPGNCFFLPQFFLICILPSTLSMIVYKCILLMKENPSGYY